MQHAQYMYKIPGGGQAATARPGPEPLTYLVYIWRYLGYIVLSVYSMVTPHGSTWPKAIYAFLQTAALELDDRVLLGMRPISPSRGPNHPVPTG